MERLCLIIDRHHAHGHLLYGMIHAVAHQLLSARYQHIVGILTLCPFHIPELIVAEILRHLLTLLDTLLVGIARIDDPHPSEVFTIGIEAGHTRAAAVGQRDHALVTALHEHRRVHHPLSDIDRLSAQHGIDVIRGDATALLEAELLVG